MADLNDRRKALEDQFFQRENERLVDEMRKRDEKQSSKEALAEASGIQDDRVLDHLVSAGIRAETLAALALVPLVEVAWADGSMDRRERRAILSAAHDSGMKESGTAYRLLEGWLNDRPRPHLLETWKEYVGSLGEHMTADTRFALMDQILGRARTVAEAAGGFLGLGSRVSSEEQAVLDQLEQAFR